MLMKEAVGFGSVHVRPLRPGEVNRLAEIVRASIEATAPQVYGDQQVAAWVSFAQPHELGPHVQAADAGFVVDMNSTPIGFATRKGNELDLLYVHPDHHRKGAARNLVRAIEDDAIANGYDRLELDASLVAEPVFKRLGFSARGRVLNQRRGVEVETVRMVKLLGGALGPE